MATAAPSSAMRVAMALPNPHAPPVTIAFSLKAVHNSSPGANEAILGDVCSIDFDSGQLRERSN
ncbi:MAG TPA: hypothetical protein VKV96_04695 [Roseiarcus sp.]|nr:hypothetical protein [Roseiarcus sp.]